MLQKANFNVLVIALIYNQLFSVGLWVLINILLHAVILMFLDY